MTDAEPAQDREALEKENRTLHKKLARTDRKMQGLEMLQNQNSNLLHALMADLDAEKAESERLLLNILPAPIAQRLKTEPGVIADRFDSVSVLFDVFINPANRLMSAFGERLTGVSSLHPNSILRTPRFVRVSIESLYGNSRCESQIEICMCLLTESHFGIGPVGDLAQHNRLCFSYFAHVIHPQRNRFVVISDSLCTDYAH